MLEQRTLDTVAFTAEKLVGTQNETRHFEIKKKKKKTKQN